MPPASTPTRRWFAAPWFLALVLTTTLQMTGSFMNQSMPVIAPLLTRDIGISAERVGWFYALTNLGSVMFLAFGAPVVLRAGPLVAMAGSVMCGACALLLVTVGAWPVVALAAWLLGLAYGPVPPASTRLLAITAPPRHRGLIFSIKQAGAQLGGVLTGLIIAPLAERLGWAVALALPASVGMLVGLMALTMRKHLDLARDPTRSIHPRAIFNLRNLRAPFAAIAADPRLIALTALTTALAVAQGCLFSFCVTFLTSRHATGLVQAGVAYACMQSGAMAGRLVLGFLTDRSGDATRNMLTQAWICVALILLWANIPLPSGAWHVAILAFLIGVMAASWNGQALAEIARIAPPDRVVEATSGSTMISFCGYVFGPALFSAGVAGFGEWHTPYAIVAAQLALTAIALPVWLRRRPASFLLAEDRPHGASPAKEDSAR